MLHSCWPLTCPLHVCGKLYIFITLRGLCLIFTLWFLVVFAVWTTDGLIFIISPLFIKWRLYSFCWLSSEVCFHFFTSAQNPSHYFFPVQTFLLLLKSHTASFCISDHLAGIKWAFTPFQHLHLISSIFQNDTDDGLVSQAFLTTLLQQYCTPSTSTA